MIDLNTIPETRHPKLKPALRPRSSFTIFYPYPSSTLALPPQAKEQTLDTSQAPPPLIHPSTRTQSVKGLFFYTFPALTLPPQVKHESTRTPPLYALPSSQGDLPFPHPSPNPDPYPNYSGLGAEVKHHQPSTSLTYFPQPSLSPPTTLPQVKELLPPLSLPVP